MDLSGNDLELGSDPSGVRDIYTNYVRETVISGLIVGTVRLL